MPAPDPVDFARLADWIDGRLSDEEARTIEKEVAQAGPETQAQAAWLRAFAEARDHVTLDSPPPEFRRRLLAVFEKQTEGQENRRPSALRRLVASLTFDSGLPSAMAGVRGAATRGSRRQLVYTTDIADVVLNISPRDRGDNLEVEGQILPNEALEPDSFDVRLLRGAAEIRAASTDDFGEFSFRDLHPGAYELLLSAEGVEIIASPVDLHA
ncbi:MAG: carboxypeptidase-like regulatory domain-containing protein [Actinomycetota bacterium]|nr:carboxypeptidase-like regulatory domain-containing protein [Actinomycetota bacterium]